jgi:heme/copper-type cytochrome/quinol oxidase subunit 2
MHFQLPAPFLMAATLALTSSIGAAPSPKVASAGGDNEAVQVIDVTAKKYEFKPSPIRVKQGARVQLKITATDHVHGFRIQEFPEGAAKEKAGLVFSSPPDCVRIEEGQTAVVEFVAQAPGTYPFRCCVRCGWHHRSMKGELIVEP